MLMYTNQTVQNQIFDKELGEFYLEDGWGLFVDGVPLDIEFAFYSITRGALGSRKSQPRCWPPSREMSWPVMDVAERM